MDTAVSLLKAKARSLDSAAIVSLVTTMTTLVLLPGFAPGVEMAQQLQRMSRASSRTPTLGVTRASMAINLRLLRIALPTLRSRAGLQLLALTIALVGRTCFSLRIAALMGDLAQRIVQGKVRPFVMAIARLAAWSLPAAVINASLKYFTSHLRIEFRSKLTDYLHRTYLHRGAFFAAVGLGTVDTVEQRVSEGVSKWADDTTSIYSAILKPLIDIAVFSWKVSNLGGGWSGPALIVGYYTAVAILIRRWSPNFARLTATQQQLDAEFRLAHSTAIAYAEEVVMEGGVEHQRIATDRTARAAHRFALYVALMRFRTNMLEGLLVKYGAVMVGYAVCAQSIFSRRSAALSAEGLTGVYMHTSQLLVNLARAVGMLLLSYRHVSSLSGSASRIDELERSIHAAVVASRMAAAQDFIVGNHIAFDGVDVVTPTGRTIVASLTFAVHAGENLLVLGPNGCGKSSTFRVLGGLWPHAHGRITRPPHHDLTYVPQRPYLCHGSLRQQIIYPDTTLRPHVGDAELYRCLELAQLGAVVERLPMGLDTPVGWDSKELSVGEAQRLAMARVFYHVPTFAILDECSSAMDVEVEGHLFRACMERHITLLTIAHRRTLWAYHSHVLRFDGEGGYLFGPFRSASDGDSLSVTVVSASDPALIGNTVVVRAIPTPLQSDETGVVSGIE